MNHYYRHKCWGVGVSSLCFGAPQLCKKQQTYNQTFFLTINLTQGMQGVRALLTQQWVSYSILVQVFFLGGNEIQSSSVFGPSFMIYKFGIELHLTGYKWKKKNSMLFQSLLSVVLGVHSLGGFLRLPYPILYRLRSW